MTTLVGLIVMCLRRFLAPFHGINQAVTQQNRAEHAMHLVANTCLTPAHSIHAPTLENHFAN